MLLDITGTNRQRQFRPVQQHCALCTSPQVLNDRWGSELADNRGWQGGARPPVLSCIEAQRVSTPNVLAVYLTVAPLILGQTICSHQHHNSGADIIRMCGDAHVLSVEG